MFVQFVIINYKIMTHTTQFKYSHHEISLGACKLKILSGHFAGKSSGIKFDMEENFHFKILFIS